jgi:hypothetical protein
MTYNQIYLVPGKRPGRKPPARRIVVKKGEPQEEMKKGWRTIKNRIAVTMRAYTFAYQ